MSVRESEFRNLGKFWCRIRNTAQGIRNPSTTDKESTGIQYLESGIHGVESRVQIEDCLRFPHMGRTFLPQRLQPKGYLTFSHCKINLPYIMSQDISRDTLVHALVGHTGVENQEGTIVLEHIPSYNSTIVFKVFWIQSWYRGIYQGPIRCYPRKRRLRQTTCIARKFHGFFGNRHFWWISVVNGGWSWREK